VLLGIRFCAIAPVHRGLGYDCTSLALFVIALLLSDLEITAVLRLGYIEKLLGVLSSSQREDDALARASFWRQKQPLLVLVEVPGNHVWSGILCLLRGVF